MKILFLTFYFSIGLFAQQIYQCVGRTTTHIKSGHEKSINLPVILTLDSSRATAQLSGMSLTGNYITTHQNNIMEYSSNEVRLLINNNILDLGFVIADNDWAITAQECQLIR